MTAQPRTLRPLLITLAIIAGSAAPALPQDSERWTQEELEEISRDIERDLEKLRAEEFERPVRVRVSDGKTFIEYAKRRAAAHTPASRQRFEELMAKHLGLIPADMNLIESTLELLEGQVGGFYDPAEDTFYLMESFTGGVAKVILAHELTHALDDQLYGIDGPIAERAQHSDSLLAYSSVVEGSGTNAMNRWVMKNAGMLSTEDLTKASSMGADKMQEAPPYLWKPMLAVYLRGENFLVSGYRTLKKQTVRGDDKPTINDAVKLAFENPPRSMEQVLHPEKYWTAEDADEPATVEHVAEIPAGWNEVGRDTLGELGLSLMLTRPEDRESFDASNPMALLTMKYTNDGASGWGGDEVVLLERPAAGDGVAARVLHLATVWDDEREAREFREKLVELLPGLEERQKVLGGGEGGWTMLEYADPRQVSLGLWSGCDPDRAQAALDALGWASEE